MSSESKGEGVGPWLWTGSSHKGRYYNAIRKFSKPSQCTYLVIYPLRHVGGSLCPMLYIMRVTEPGVLGLYFACIILIGIRVEVARDVGRRRRLIVVGIERRR
jgi:hypothetical protein